MQRKDWIVLKKVQKELETNDELLGNAGLEEFLQNEMQKRAVAMTVINIGELVKVLSNETREKYSEVPWRQITGIRDITAHRYQTLRMEDVYNTAKYDFAELKSQISHILETEPKPDDM